jgi:L-asparaginase II
MNLSLQSDAPRRVLVVRGGTVESVHQVAVAVVDASGRLLASAGDPGVITGYRSAAKPMQALPLVEDGVVERFGITQEELALCCASHSGEERHLNGARSILGKAGVGADALACGAHPPFWQPDADRLLREGRAPERLHNNCSGKHAGMLALARAHGWPTQGYHLPDHPVQRRMLGEVSRWSGLQDNDIETAIDGCGVTCFALPLKAMARSFAAFADAASEGAPPARVVEAMTAHPFMVAGTGRLCTAVMETAGDRVFLKTGAEGVYCAALRGEGVGVALKVLDGTKRAAEPALVGVLEAMGVLTQDDLETLSDFRRPPLKNTRGELVGEVRFE